MNIDLNIYHRLLIFIISFFCSFYCRASESNESKSPTFLKKNYYLIRASKSYPILDNPQNIMEGNISYFAGYSYTIDQNFVVTISLGFNSFKQKISKEEFSYFKLSNESVKLFRLYHPLYFLAGGRLNYLIPSLNSSFPIKENKSLANEVGAGIVTGLLFVYSKEVLVESKIALWRGTNTSNHKGLEFSIGLSFNRF